MNISTEILSRWRSCRVSCGVMPAVGAVGLLLLSAAIAWSNFGFSTPGTSLMNVTRLGNESPEAVTDVAPSMDADVEVIFEEPANSNEIRYFDGRPIRPSKLIHMKVTAYSPDARSCAPFDDGITASGYSVFTNGGALIAADKKFKFGTLLSVPGYNGGRPTPVLDRGGKIKGNRLDVLYPTHNEALQWGVQNLTVTIWEYVDEGNG